MTAELEQQARQLAFERDYAEAAIGRLYVQNQHQQQLIERYAAILAAHGINPDTGQLRDDLPQVDAVTEIVRPAKK